MGFADTMRILSNINCGLASFNTYMDMRSNGVNKGQALTSLFGNLGNGMIRNEIAYDMQRWGNPVGNVINMYAGYGTPEANYNGMAGLLCANTAFMYTMSPWMYSRCYSFMPMMTMPMTMNYNFNYLMGCGGFIC